MKNTYFLSFYALLIAISVTLLIFLGAFAVLDEWGYDIFERLTSQTHTKVLLIEAPHETRELGDQTWLRLLEILEQKNAKQVVFSFMPQGVSSAFYCQAKQYGNVFFARSLQLEPLPADCEIDFGLVDIPPQTYGVHSKQYSAFQINGQSYPALEVVAAQHFLGKTLQFYEAEYRVHFGRGLEWLPKLKLERVLAGDLVSELVDQRSVLIGLTHPSEFPGLHTPLAMTHDVTISMPQYQMLALNTLLNERHFTTFDAKMTFLWMLIPIAISFILYSWLKIEQSWQLTLILICIYIILAWLLYASNILFPLLEMIVAQWFMDWFLFHKKIVTTNRQLHDTLVDNSFKLEGKIQAEHFTTTEYWAQLVVMLNQILNLNRLIILGWKPGLNSAEEVKALGCSLADVKQRDYKREPYRTVIRKKHLFHLNKPLLKPVDVAEEQYLMPLIFGGDVLGFLVMAIETAKRYDDYQFDEEVNDFAKQISQSLYHRQQGQSAVPDLESNEWLYKTLDKSILALEHQLSFLENLINDLETATTLYDMFGTALRVNKSMNHLSHIFGLTEHQKSALDLISNLLKVETEQARQYFRDILFKQGTIVRLVTLSAAGVERFFVLHLQNLSYQEMVGGTELEIKQGILCQLFDITQMKLLSTLKEQIAERLIFQFRNDMQSILTATQLLGSEGISDDEIQMVTDIIETKVEEHMEILTEVEKQLNVQIDAAKQVTIETYPVNAKEPVLEAMGMLAEAAVERQLKLQSHLPDLVSLVYASPKGLTLLITDMLKLLIDDAVENTQITLELQQEEKWITYTFKNTGFGVPNERFQQYLFDEDGGKVSSHSLLVDDDESLIFSDSSEVSDKFKALREAIPAVTVWGGSLKAESSVGQGMFFELRLRGFL
jgi:signal transduction histidine kinase